MPMIDTAGWDEAIKKAPIGVFRTNHDGGFVYANTALAKIFGYDSAEELVDEVQDIAKDLLKDPAQRQEVLALLDEQGQVRDFVYQAQLKDRTIRFVSFSARKVSDEQNGKFYYEGFMHDVTEQKLAEARLNTILTEIQGMAYQCEPNHPWEMKWVSDGCRELTGYYKEDFENNFPAYGDIIWDSTHQDEVAKRIDEAIKKNTTYTLIYPIRTAQGEKKWLFERGRAVRDEKGKVIYLEGVIQNYNNEDREGFERERHENEMRNERQNQNLRRVMGWAIVVQFIVANLVILGVVLWRAETISDGSLAAFFAATVAELAAIIFLVFKYLFPTKNSKNSAENYPGEDSKPNVDSNSPNPEEQDGPPSLAGPKRKRNVAKK
jgi:HTH-type transcriptional regulator, bacterioopsin transcriptional activator and related proteins